MASCYSSRVDVAMHARLETQTFLYINVLSLLLPQKFLHIIILRDYLHKREKERNLRGEPDKTIR